VIARLAASVAVAAAVAGGAWLAGGAIGVRGAHLPTVAPDPEASRRFGRVFERLRGEYVDSMSDGELYVRAARGLVSQLHDPYATLLIGPEFDQLRERTTGDYAGVGLQVEARNGTLVVVAPVPDSPAEKSGIRTGDVITAIDGRDATGWTVVQSREALRGAAGSTVSLSIRRDGGAESLVYQLVRSRVHQSAVRNQTLFPDGVGYVRLATVSERSADELRTAVEALMAGGMRVLLLDLRSNPGGLRDEAVRASDLFLDRGQAILETRGRAPGDTRSFVDSAPQPWPSLPILVLVNEGTASAAEIIAGALQDHDRAVVVGTATYGKGLVQTVFPLGDRVALRITTARWLTPSGRSIQRALPDSLGPVAHVDTSGRFRTDRGRLINTGGGIAPDVVMKPDTLSADEQKLGRLFAAQMDPFRDVLAQYAIELKATNALPGQSFAVTDEMRTQVLARLRKRGLAISDSLYAAGIRLVDRELGFEVARYAYGRDVEARRRVDMDAQVVAARALANGGNITALLGAPLGQRGASAGR
jgi:carboxyl-terminal processing protease